MKKFMNPLVNAGFKRIFGRKMYMREFLNDLLMREHPIRRIWFLDKEMVPDSDRDHGVVYDLYCEADNGEQFIVEMQYKSHQYFKERTVYYMARSIVAQSRYEKKEDRGKWDYRLTPVYCIYLLNFHMESDEPDTRQRKVMLTDVLTNKVFYDHMTMYFLELPIYKKCTEKECESEIDKWLYVLTNMNRFKSFPFKKDKPIFMQMEELANLSTFSKEEMLMYEKSLDNYRINRLVQETCRDEGFQEGKEQGLKQGIEQGMREKVLQIARKMKDTQTPIDIIMEITDLSQDEIEKL